MKRILGCVAALGCGAALLAGCTGAVTAHNHAYLNNDQTIQPIVTTNPADQRQLESYYAVPVISTTHQAAPSYLPPTMKTSTSQQNSNA